MTLPERCEWLARDEDGDLWAFIEKPEKLAGYWIEESGYYYYYFVSEHATDKYKHIKWDDIEPTRISEQTDQDHVDSIDNLMSNYTEKIESLRVEIHQLTDSSLSAWVEDSVRLEIQQTLKEKNETYMDYLVIVRNLSSARRLMVNHVKVDPTEKERD